MADTVTPEQVAAAALERAYAAAASSTIAHAREIAERRRQLADALTGDQPDGPRIPPRLTEADLAELHAVEQELGIKEFSRWTPSVTVAMIRRLPESLAELLVAHWDENMARGWRCLELGHDGQLAMLREAHLEAHQAHRCWEHTHEKVNLGG